MNSDIIVVLSISLLCAVWAVFLLTRPSRHYWIDPEPPLVPGPSGGRAHRQCPFCESTIFYAKTTDGKTLALDASTTVYVPVKLPPDRTRVVPVAAYIEHAALCRAIPEGRALNGATHAHH